MGDYQNNRLNEITDQLEKGLQDLFSSGQYDNYLKIMSKFYDYSVSNSLLIFMQRPDASHVAGFGAWKKNFKRHVKQGERGIKILAPIPYKQMVEMEKIDPVTQGAMTGADGKPVTEVMEVTRAAFKLVTVFDVSQTEGEPLPQLGVNELTGDVENYLEFFEALKQVAPFPVSFETITSGAKGYCNYQEQRIAINEGMAEIQNVKTTIHEITHATLHNYYAEKEKNIVPENRKDRRTREVEAESVAYTVCQHYGINTADYSFGYIAGWSSDRETKELKASLATIRETAANLITSIDEKYQELVKKQEQQRAAEKEKPLAAAELSSEQNTNMIDGQINNLPPELDPAIQPVVTIIWSESDQLREGEQMSLAKADLLFQKLDAEHGAGYDKTKFSIVYTMNGELASYEGRQDFGDGDGSLVQHIEAYHQYYAKDEQWRNHVLHMDGPEALEQDTAQREQLLNEFIPYLKLHCNLTQMEQVKTEQLEMLRGIPEPDALDCSKITYYEAIQAYVDDYRHELNTATSEYHFPELPKEQDTHATELLAYQEQVREEVRQEAAVAGMTIEEYAANGYEPLSVPFLEQEQNRKLPAELQHKDRTEKSSIRAKLEATKIAQAVKQEANDTKKKDKEIVIG